MLASFFVYMANKFIPIRIPIDSIELKGDLIIPDKAQSIIVFAHGSGSSRLSPRNNYVAGVLNQAGFATLLFDLLSEEEDKDYENRFDIELLIERLGIVNNWLREQEETKGLQVGYFGASTGAAAALGVVAEFNIKEGAIVSRGGRPDLAGSLLANVEIPCLFIVGGDDRDVIELNRQSMDKMNCTKKLEIIPGATHLFEEEGALEDVADLAVSWFKKYL
jgi:pimeloyl-ACP methyl ester carboxylesterase